MPAASLIDTIVGGCYRLTRPLGEGGMGMVYEALHLRLGGKVAIKILSPQYAADLKFRDRFKREARAASQIRHPNVVQITDFGETPSGSVFFAMELLEGRDLHRVLREHAPAPLPWVRALHMLAQASDALAAAHRSGVVHRDIKPSNIFVLDGPGLQDFVKLLDFGIAKVVAPTATADSALVKNLTGTGEIFGTAKYMAPEQAYGSSSDPRMDVYSLGVVAYELLTGRVPFTGQSSFEIITRHVYDSPRPLRVQGLPATLEAVVLRALEKQPENRFTTMEEFGRALRQAGGSAVLDSSAPRARVHTSTDANTLPRAHPKDLPSTEPTMFERPVLAAGAPQTAMAAPGGAAPVVRKTLATVAAPSPMAVAGPVVHAPIPAVPPPIAHPAAPPFAHMQGAPAAPPPVARLAAPEPVASPTDQLGHAQAPTGPLGHRRGAGYDDTSRDLGMRPPAASSSMGRQVALGFSASLLVALWLGLAVVVAVGADEVEPTSTRARAPAAAPPIMIRPPTTAPAPTPDPVAEAPAVDGVSQDGTNEPDAMAEEPPTVAAPTPALDVTAPPDEPPTTSDAASFSPKPSPKARPRSVPHGADPDPTGEISRQIGREIQRRIKHECQKLGSGKEVSIELKVGKDGRISNRVIGAVGPLRACIITAIGEPQFPKATKLKLSPVVGKCIEAFAAQPKCK